MTETDKKDDALNRKYVPPKVWTFEENQNASKFSMNRPTAGVRHTQKLERGNHPIQLYSLATPNGQKVTILLEELLEAGKTDAEYDAWHIDIMKSGQFGSDFVDINPNSKIPAMRIYENKDGTESSTPLFESGSILLHLAEKFDMFLPREKRSDVLNWLFWQMGSAPYLGGGFGHFFAYANEKQQYPIDRFTMETKRQLDVLDKQLAKTGKYVVGNEYTIADMAIWPWYGQICLGALYENSDVFLNVKEYANVIRWGKEIAERPAVKRGIMVNKTWGPEDKQLRERHDASDFDKVKVQSSKKRKDHPE